MWYDGEQLLSHNCFVNIITGARGCGKTVWMLNKIVIPKWIKAKEETMYIRRRKEDLTESMATLMDDVISLELYPDLEFNVVSNNVYCRFIGDTNWEIMIRGKALSVTRRRKGAPFPYVTTMWLEEFIDEDDNYLTDEIQAFVSLLESVKRRRTNVKVYMLGNRYSLSNPYYDSWHIHPQENAKFTKDKSRSIIINQWHNEEFHNLKKHDELSMLMAGTIYGDFMLNDTTIGDDYTLVGKASGHKTYRFSLSTPVGNVHMWELADGRAYFCAQTDKAKEVWYSTNNGKVVESKNGKPMFLLRNMRSGNFYKTLENKIKNCEVLFQTAQYKRTVLSAFGFMV